MYYNIIVFRLKRRIGNYRYIGEFNNVRTLNVIWFIWVVNQINYLHAFDAASPIPASSSLFNRYT